MPETKEPPPLVIGLTGPFGSGVTTVSKVLEEMGFHRVSLSDPIKRQLEEQETTPAPQERRRKLQDICNDGRKKSPTFWLDRTLEGIDRSNPLVIDAVRNPLEIRGIREDFTNSFVIAVVASKLDFCTFGATDAQLAGK